MRTTSVTDRERQASQSVDAKKQYAVDQAMRALRNESSKYRKLYDEARQAFESYKTANAVLGELEARFVEPAPISFKEASGTSESVLVALGSDWHVYETVKPEQVSGLNTYNVDIARASVERFHRGVLKWCNIHRAGTKIDTLVLAYLGDLMTGMLHEDQMENNFGTPLEEALCVTELVCSGIEYLLKYGEFKTIKVISCDGNHSRITEKKRKTNRVRHSLEWLIFQFIKTRFADTPALEFTVADGIHVYLDLDCAGGKTLRFCHGDEAILFQGGVGGLSISANKAIDKWNVGRRADLDAFGHHHTSEHPRRYVSNGSILGYSPFSLTGKYEFEVPSQTLLLLEKDKWETAYHKLYVR